MRNTLENKILSLVIIPLTIGIIIFYLVDIRIERDNLLQDELQKVALVSNTVMDGIENAMLAGRGEYARKLIDHIAEEAKQTGGIKRVEVYNGGGLEALMGNKGKIPTADIRARLQQVVKSGQPTQYTYQEGGYEITADLKPLLNKVECQGCHAVGDPAIGVVLIASSNNELDTAAESNYMLIAGMAISTIVLMVIVLRILVRRNIVFPIRDLTKAMTDIADGHSFEPIKTGFKDEIGQLVENFNRMSRNLLESQTSLRKSHEELEASNTLLKTLNQEMHHRIRNNLQTMADLLSLELAHQEGQSSRESIRDSIGRVKSIAAVHELLHPDTVGATNIKEIAERVVAISAMGIQGRGKLITTAVNGPDVLLTSKQATAVALVLNEVVSNAFEHGFPDPEATGEIVVDLKNRETGLTITVTNNGAGLPRDFYLPRSQGLGMQIARKLVDNDLKGMLTLESRGGKTIGTIFFVPADSSSQ